MSDEDRYRYGFYRLLTGAVGCEHEATFGLFDYQEAANLQSKAKMAKEHLLIQFGAAKDALGINVARHMLVSEAQELARLHAELAKYAEEIANKDWLEVMVP